MTERSEGDDDGPDVSGKLRIQFDPDAGSGAIDDDAVDVLSTSGMERRSG